MPVLEYLTTIYNLHRVADSNPPLSALDKPWLCYRAANGWFTEDTWPVENGTVIFSSNNFELLWIVS